MARSNFLRPLSAVFLLGLLPAGAACNGHVISLGDTGDTIQPITSSQTASEVTPTTTSPLTCAPGWAHPNVCCTAASSGASSTCGAWEQNPFRACDTGDTTYPDLLSCCQLSNPSNCSDTPPTGVPTPPTPPPAYGCGFACPPGWWTQAAGAITPEGPEGPMCCGVQPGGVTECVPQGENVDVAVPVSCGATLSGGSSSGSSTGSGAVDAGGPTTNDDAGILPGGWIGEDGGACSDDAGYPYGNYDGGTASLCGACPTGWSASNSAQPELCCQSIGGGTTLCFSQATGSATSTSSSGGSSSSGSTGVSTPPSSGWGSGGGTEDGGPAPSCSGSDSSCSCSDTVNGHSYALNCTAASNGTISCSCTVDGASTGSAPSVDSCQDSVAVTNAFTASSGCGFP